jgi:ribonucleoside-diphosphate reductase alpha chain
VLEETKTVEVYIIVGLFENDQPGEVFIKLNHYGDTIKGFAEQWATVVSIALQHEIPLEVICAKGVHSRFEPSGYTDDIMYDSNGKPVGRISATSVIDYVCRWLLKTFSKEV